MSERECCANYRFMHVVHTEYEEPDEYMRGSTDTVVGRYECRESSPQRYVDHDSRWASTRSGWPNVHPLEWCGRFQKAPEA